MRNSTVAAKRKQAKRKRTPRKSVERFTVNALSDQTGIDRRTIKRRLIEAGIEPAGKHALGDVVDVIKPPEPKDGATIREKKIFEEWRKLKLANDLKDGVVVEKTWIVERLQRFAAKACDILDNTLVNEAPPKIVPPEEVPNARVQIRRYVDSAKEAIQKLATIFDE